MIFEKKKFIDFIKLQRGYDLTKDEIVDGVYPIVSSTSIIGFHNEYKMEGPGVVTGRSGTIGQVQYVEGRYWPHNTTLFVKDFKGNYPKFVYYFMKNFGLEGVKGGSAVPTLNRNSLSNIEVNIPNLNLQKRIAGILSSYDNLIKNNEKQIKLLEEAAQRLYKEWFVDLRFPGHEKEEIVDGIPNGWSKVSISSICNRLESGRRPKGGVDLSLKNGIPSIGAENVIGLGKYNFSSEKMISYDFFSKMKKGHILNKDILIYKDGAYIGKTSLFQDNFPHKKVAVNEHVFLLHAIDEKVQYYVFFTLYQKEYFEIMQHLNKNAAQPGLNQNSINSLEVLMPKLNLVYQFDSIVKNYVTKIFTLAKQNKKLIESRDRLLPKLMNGEIKV